MEPAFYRGDLLFLTNPPQEKYQTGDITVYKIPGNEIPIVHRVLETHDVTPKKKKSKKSDVERGCVVLPERSSYIHGHC
jgi:signal peptidase